MATTLERLLDVEQIDDNLFRGLSPATRLQRIFGGQVAGQALVAATRTVDPAYEVHSLHGYFMRAGRPEAPVVYLVDRLRDGRSFMTRRVTGVQGGQAIFTMSASCQRPEKGLEHADTAPASPQPDGLAERAVVDPDEAEMHRLEWPGWDLREVPRAALPAGSHGQQVWMRYRERLPSTPVLHVCALAYASDLRLLSASLIRHPNALLTQSASLDHAMWFLRPFRADDWLLYDQSSPSATGGRGLTQGRIFDRSGTLVATVVQEGLIRTE